MLFDHFELIKSDLRTCQVHISVAIVLCREESTDLHTLSENDVVSRAVVLPEASTGSSAARGLLVNNKGSLS